MNLSKYQLDLILFIRFIRFILFLFYSYVTLVKSKLSTFMKKD